MFASAQRRVGRMSRLIRGAPLAVFALLALAAPAAAQSGSASPDLFGTVAFRVGTSAYEARWAPVLASRPDSAAWSRLLASGRAATSEAGKIAAVNQAVNASLEFGSDEALYGRSDHWAAPDETLIRGAGDCEDYAILKMAALGALGISPDDIYLVILTDLVARADHAVLAVRTGQGMVILDNRTDQVLSAEAVRDYRPIVTLGVGQAWVHGYRDSGPAIRQMAAAPGEQAKL